MKFASNLYLQSWRLRDPQAYTQLCQRLTEIESAKNIGGQPPDLPFHAPEVYPAIVSSLDVPVSLALLRRIPGCASSLKNPLERSGHRQGTEQDRPQRFRRETGLPHRSLPLAKTPYRNLLVLRFGNGIFEPLWNRNYVDHVQITASETLGVERRGGFMKLPVRSAI